MDFLCISLLHFINKVVIQLQKNLIMCLFFFCRCNHDPFPVACKFINSTVIVKFMRHFYKTCVMFNLSVNFSFLYTYFFYSPYTSNRNFPLLRYYEQISKDS